MARRRDSLYPSSPAEVPADLTAPHPGLRFQAFIVLMSLFFFFFLYLGLVIGSGYLVYLAFTRPVRNNDFILNILLAIPAAMLFLFLLKGFFKRHKVEKSYDIEITEEEHPRLFDFIERLCDEISAPRPRRVFVNFEVNASAGYDTTFLNLFWSKAKDLRVGLGLVNFLNLTEFKALLAHEFGHFSQHSMKIGGYVYMARRIVADVVYGRDRFDDFLSIWARLDIRIAWMAWIFIGIIWLLRQMLSLIFKGIFFLDKALSRQMEFNADLVAVSVTGSDAPVHLLARSVFADACLNQALTELSNAVDHHLYSRDIFVHQARAAAYIRKVTKKPRLGEVPSLPKDPEETTEVFDPADDDDLPLMWLDHPPNSERERNAKEEYIRSKFDERSPWLLFEDQDELRERVSFRYYRFGYRIPRDTILVDPEEVQEFIAEERAETTYDPRYHGAYDNRIIEPGEIGELITQANSKKPPREQLAKVHAELYNVEVKHFVQRRNKRLDELDLLEAIVNKQHRPKNDEIEFRGDIYELADAKKLCKRVDKELQEDRDWLADLDRKVFLVHYRMATQSDPAAADELAERYRFHLGVQKIWSDLRAQEGPVSAALAFLDSQNSRQMDQGAFQEVLAIFGKAQDVLADSLAAAKNLIVPSLKNMTAGEPLRPFLLQKKLVHELVRGDQEITGAWINKFLQQLGEVQKKVNRIHFKSLGGLLALQENIAAKFTGSAAPGAPSTSVSASPAAGRSGRTPPCL